MQDTSIKESPHCYAKLLNYQLRKMEKAIAGTDLFLLDELSYASFTQEESELLFNRKDKYCDYDESGIF